MKIDMLRVRSVTGPVIVLITIGSWLAASNHCAIAVAVSQEKVAQNECPFHSHPSKPAKQKDPSGQPCCKILRAIATSSAKNLARAIVDLTNVDLAFTKLVTISPPAISLGFAALDTGPPGATSFAELILQRSILAHAPPSRAQL